MSLVTINLTLDPDKLREVIEDAKRLEQNPQLFKQLAQIAEAKSQVKALLEQVDAVESEAKALINERAKQSDKNWTVILGEGYKINRSQTGLKYKIVDEKKAAPYTKPKPDSGKIDAYYETESKLPDGIAENERGESINFTVEK